MSVQDGWMDGVERVETAAAGGYPATPDGQMWPKQIVFHVMQGYQSTMVSWAQERPPVTRASAHFTIGRNGRVVQHKSIWTPCWHVAWQAWNQHSIGIEQEGFSVAPGYGYDYLYSDAQPWPEAMIEAATDVMEWVFNAIRAYDPSVIPGPDTILTHALTGQPDRQQDPGEAWMRQVYPRLLAVYTPPSPPPPPADSALLRDAQFHIQQGYDLLAQYLAQLEA